MQKKDIFDLTEENIKVLFESIRPPIEVRNQVDFGYIYENKTLELFEIRPRWDNPEILINMSFAKLKYISNKKIWKIYWKRASGKWEEYQPEPTVNDLFTAFKIIQEDKFYCFFG